MTTVILLDRMDSCRRARRGRDTGGASVIGMRLEGKTYREIGEVLGVSRQRAEQLGSPPKAVIAQLRERAGGKCERCGINVNGSGHAHHNGHDEETYQYISELLYLCQPCHRTVHAEIAKPCPQCGKPMTRTLAAGHKFCSRECWQESTLVTLQCEECGALFQRGRKFVNHATRFNYKHCWCSKKCQGHWLGKNHVPSRKQP